MVVWIVIPYHKLSYFWAPPYYFLIIKHIHDSTITTSTQACIFGWGFERKKTVGLISGDARINSNGVGQDNAWVNNMYTYGWSLLHVEDVAFLLAKNRPFCAEPMIFFLSNNEALKNYKRDPWSIIWIKITIFKSKIDLCWCKNSFKLFFFILDITLATYIS